MDKTSFVLILADLHYNNSESIDMEIEVASILGKPIIAIIPRGSKKLHLRCLELQVKWFIGMKKASLKLLKNLPVKVALYRRKELTFC